MNHLAKLLILLSAALCGLTAHAQSGPFSFNYQGRVVSPDTGLPVTGARTLIFRLYTAPSGGTAAWARQYALDLGASGGFNVALNDSATVVPAGPTNALADVFAANALLFLSLEVSGTPGEPGLRLQLVSSPYAMKAHRAGTVSNAITATVAGGASGTLINSNGTAGGFVIQSTGTNGTLRLDSRGIESSAPLQLRPATNGVVRIGGQLRIGGTILNTATNLNQNYNVLGYTFVAGSDGFLVVRSDDNDIEITIAGIVFRSELDTEQNTTNESFYTFPVAKGETVNVKRTSGAGALDVYWQPFGQ